MALKDLEIKVILMDILILKTSGSILREINTRGSALVLLYWIVLRNHFHS